MFAKSHMTSKAHRRAFGDPALDELTPLDCLTLDFCLWVASCVKRLDVTLQLRKEMVGVELKLPGVSEEMILYSCESAS